jgi:surfeit locus 1 family protein
MRLAFWQLSRAAQKTALQQAIENQSQLPPLTMAQLQNTPSAWTQTHRRVQLHGQWLNDQTIFLDNRAHHGRVGFWVMSPLRVQAGQVVWVQRGWVERDPVDPRKPPQLSPVADDQRIEARIAPALSQQFELGSAPAEADGNPSRIRANLDLVQMQSLVQDNVLGLVVQTGPADDGLRRDWPAVASSADKNRAYAFQWFALSALLAFLYLWFQWINPYRHGRQQS